MLTQNFVQHKQLLAEKATRIDALNAEIQELSNTQRQEADSLAVLQLRTRARSDRVAKIANFCRIIDERRRRNSQTQNSKGGVPIGEAEKHVPALAPVADALRKLPSEDADAADRALDSVGSYEVQEAVASLSLPTLHALVATYEQNNSNLEHVAGALMKRSSQLEESYRKVVAICTGVPEDRVEESLPLLQAAVESEAGSLGINREELGRVRGFLVKVEGAVGKDGEGSSGGAGGGGGVNETPRARMMMQRQQQQQQQQQQAQRGMMGPPGLPA